MGALVYSIDSEDRIAHVNDTWTRYAIDVGQVDTVGDAKVLGRDIWSSISDPTTIELYRLIVKLARSGKVVRFHYRCDVPTFRRVYQMRVEAGHHGSVVFTSTLASEEARPAVALLDPRVENRVGSIRMCSWCQRVAGPGDEWMSVERALDSLRLLETGALPIVTHGICEQCADRMRAILQAEGA